MQMFYYSNSTPTEVYTGNETIIGSAMNYYSYNEPASLFYGVPRTNLKKEATTDVTLYGHHHR